MGINQPSEVTCPICHSTFTEGYATQDGQYVCSECTRQSVDTAKVYSKKAALSLDEKLGEYIEKDGGFICTVCGKKYSKLLEFKCSHDNSSVCIYHTGTYICAKPSLNLTSNTQATSSGNDAPNTQRRHKMHSNFNGVIKEILEQYPNIDLAEYLADNLQLPMEKAEVLASRIEKQILQKGIGAKEAKTLRPGEIS